MSNPNRLAQETSPYLLQHSKNPVDWYPWGPEALQKALNDAQAAVNKLRNPLDDASFEVSNIQKIVNSVQANYDIDSSLAIEANRMASLNKPLETTN